MRQTTCRVRTKLVREAEGGRETGSDDGSGEARMQNAPGDPRGRLRFPLALFVLHYGFLIYRHLVFARRALSSGVA